MKLRIAWNEPLPDEQRQRLAKQNEDCEFLFCDEAGTENRASFDAAEADIFYGQPDPALLFANANLRWVHLSTAGYTRYDRDDLRETFQQRNAALTNSSLVYAEPCAQHLAAMILAFARDLPGCLDNQRGPRRWMDFTERSQRTYLLGDQSAIIYGFGAIARRLVAILEPLSMRLTGVRRRPRGDEAIPMISEGEADEALPGFDHVVNILPHSPSTVGFFGAQRFAKFKPDAHFYNIGRGATVDQEALMRALTEKRLAGAYLDVTDPEPLPPSHPLWAAPNCFVLPHFGGGFAGEKAALAAHFEANLRLFRQGDELADRVY